MGNNFRKQNLTQNKTVTKIILQEHTFTKNIAFREVAMFSVVEN